MIPETYPRVSRETQARLETYGALLAKWQAKINLVAPDTIPDAWERHFLDSLQLLPHIVGPTVVDLGTGAGFPGLVLAIARPDWTVHLVESDAKKIEFLKAVSRETSTRIQCHPARIETLTPFAADTIAARALAPLVDLLTLAQPFVSVNPDLTLVFPKGATWRDEVAAARQKFNFILDDHPSLTSPQGRVLIIRDVQPI